MIQALLDLPTDEIAVPRDELERLKQQVNSLRSEIEADKLPRIGAFYAAKQAELLDIYRLFYVPYSNTVHTAVRDLASHVNEGPGGDVASLKWGPESAEVERPD